MIHLEMPEAEYHALPALSASGAWEIASTCPAEYWYGSPFNPDAAAPETKTEFDVGTALHLAVLEPDRRDARILVVEAKDWRTKEARDQREEAYAAGKIPLLAKQEGIIDAMAAALRRNAWVRDLLDGAQTEVSATWDAAGIPCKARADIVSKDGRLADLKTAASPSPDFFRRQAWANGHFLRAPWYIDGFREAGEQVQDDYWFVVVGKDAPHLVTVLKLNEGAMAWGQMMARHALMKFQQCRAENRWPGYADEPVTVGLPNWAEYQMAEREQAGEFRVPLSAIAAGNQFLEP